MDMKRNLKTIIFTDISHMIDTPSLHLLKYLRKNIPP